MEHQTIDAIYSLSLPIAYIGLFLALSDLRKWSWLGKAEIFVGKIAKKRRSVFGGIDLGFVGLEFVAGVLAIAGFYLFGVRLEGKVYFLVYGLALVVLMVLPFICHSLKLFGKDRAIGSIGAMLACIGVAITTAQQLGLGS